MDRRAYVGVGVEIVKILHDVHHKVIPFKRHGTKLLHIGPSDIDHNRHGIGQYDRPHPFPKGFHLKEKPEGTESDEKHEPIIVGDHEPLAKGDQIIPCTVNGLICNVKPARKMSFQDPEYGAV